MHTHAHIDCFLTYWTHTHAHIDCFLIYWTHTHAHIDCFLIYWTHTHAHIDCFLIYWTHSHAHIDCFLIYWTHTHAHIDCSIHVSCTLLYSLYSSILLYCHYYIYYVFKVCSEGDVQTLGCRPLCVIHTFVYKLEFLNAGLQQILAITLKGCTHRAMILCDGAVDNH